MIVHSYKDFKSVENTIGQTFYYNLYKIMEN